MSRRSLSLLVSAALLFTASTALAEVKLGYVDLQRALAQVDEGKAARSRLEKTLAAKQKKLAGDQAALRAELEALSKKAAAMSEEKRQAEQARLQQKFMQLNQEVEQERAAMAQEEQAALQAILQKMNPIIVSIAEREGLTMVLEKTDSGIIYAPSHLDITNEVVRRFNADGAKKGSSKAKRSSGKN